MKKFSRIVNLGFLALPILFVACAQPSEAEKQKRRENAFDVAGGYSATSASGSEVELAMQIANKGARSDISITVDRSSPLTAQENAKLTAWGIKDSDWKNVIGNKIVLDADEEARENGGSNVSDDFGKTDKVYVRTKTFTLSPNVQGDYSLRGSFKKEDLSFVGTLSLNLSRTTQTTGEDGKPATRLELE